MKYQTLMLVPLDVIDVANEAAEAMVSRAGEGENTFRAGNRAGDFALACAYLTEEQRAQVDALASELGGHAITISEREGREWRRFQTIDEALTELGLERYNPSEEP